jgi:hypothetical protein
MSKPKVNKHRSTKEVKIDRERNARRKETIATRTSGQFIDLPPGKRQKIINSLRR